MRMQKDVSVKNYTRFQLGGTVAYFIEVSDWRGIVKAVRGVQVRGLPYYVVAGGSNLAIADGKLDIVLIHIRETARLADKVQFKSPTSKAGSRRKASKFAVVRADACVQLWAFIQVLIKKGCAGIESLSGIPGTLGGAVVGNAGAYGSEVREYLTRVRVYDGRHVRWISNDECNFRYRHSIFKERPWLVLEAEFKFPKGDPKELKKTSDATLVKRSKFRWEMKTPGSYFKNIVASTLPPKILNSLDSGKFIGGKVPVGYLLEAVGSKGMRVGGIYVSDFHANVFINDGDGKYEDLTSLIAELKKRVKEKFNIDIEEEVRRVDHSIFTK